MSNDPQPDNTLPQDLDEEGNPVYPDQTLPGEQPPRGREANRGRSEDAPGHNKAEPKE